MDTEDLGEYSLSVCRVHWDKAPDSFIKIKVMLTYTAKEHRTEESQSKIKEETVIV